jgi:calcineurin-like phosphoesterase family protein
VTRLVCTADIHEHLPDIPACDLLLIAGDVSFAFKGDLATEHAFLEGPFAEWLDRVPTAETVLVAGNHDQSIEAWGVPPGLRCRYLEDAGAELCGLKVWGTPWQPWFYDWAYNAPRRDGERFLAEKFALIPDDTDIVVCHGPPRGHGDHAPGSKGQPHIGSSALTDAIQRLQPRLVVVGHIHPGYGRYRLGETEIVNAAYVDNDYRPVNPVVEVEL